MLGAMPGWGFGSLAGLAVVAACSSSRPPTYVAPPDAGAGDDVDASVPDANLVGNGDANGHPCVRLECQQLDCSRQNAPPTTVSGVVFDPAGKHPLYDVIVYVPNDAGAAARARRGLRSVRRPRERLAPGHGAHGVGRALRAPDVPVGTNIPLVLQLGKWRKQLVIPEVKACQDTPMSNPSIMRLPAKQSEGDMPQLAVATGGCDPFECLLRKIGIDASEFTGPTGGGKVHLYQGTGGSALPGVDGDRGRPLGEPDAGQLRHRRQRLRVQRGAGGEAAVVDRQPRGLRERGRAPLQHALPLLLDRPEQDRDGPAGVEQPRVDEHRVVHPGGGRHDVDRRLHRHHLPEGRGLLGVAHEGRAARRRRGSSRSTRLATT